jgi:hypothetical protein
VHEQVGTLIGAAKDAERNRLHAQEEAGAMIVALRKMETDLAALMIEVRNEADALEQSVALEPEREPEPAPAPEFAPTVEQREEADPAEGAEHGERADDDQMSDAVVEDDDGSERHEAVRPEGGLEAEARSRVVGKTDLDLAELHRIAQDRAETGSDGERNYWRTLLAATVDEAVRRPDFGASTGDEEDGGWLVRRRRAKSLKKLVVARGRAIQTASREDATS